MKWNTASVGACAAKWVYGSSPCRTPSRANARYPKTSWEISGGPSSRLTSASAIAPASAAIGSLRAVNSTSP
jgi:hypothetical protein